MLNLCDFLMKNEFELENSMNIHTWLQVTLLKKITNWLS